ncbi:hypothetical protein [Saccharopolyspora taberi]|uniref:Uncharacterized protein n=1 Tax=Saccharopolyspora taberi TaxID=60895 RepID=A0ABN3VND9_9PSEU
MLQQAPPKTAEDPRFLALGWHVEGGVLVLDDHVEALFMPAPLASRVHHVLAVHMLAGPAIAYPDHWALLTGPDVRELPEDGVFGAVRTSHPGDRVPLPPLDGADWVTGPTDPPSWQTVVSATRRAAAR